MKKKSINNLFNLVDILNTFGGRVKKWPLKYKAFFGLHLFNEKSRELIHSYQKTDEALKFLPCLDNQEVEEKIMTKFKKFNQKNELSNKRKWAQEIKLLFAELFPFKSSPLSHLTYSWGLVAILLSVYFSLNFFVNNLDLPSYLSSSLANEGIDLVLNENNNVIETDISTVITDDELINIFNGKFIEF